MDKLLSEDLQDVLPCPDIKNEIYAVLGRNETDTSWNSNDFPNLELDENFGTEAGDLMWFTGNGNSNSSSNFNLEFGGSSEGGGKLVSPASVMPIAMVAVPSTSSQSISISTFRSTATATVTTSTLSFSGAISPPLSPVNVDDKLCFSQSSPVAKPVGFLCRPSSMQSQSNNVRILTSSATSRLPNILSVSRSISSQVASQANGSSGRHLQVQSSQVQQKKGPTMKSLARHYTEVDEDDRAYPKPAYSYSCLIAMALKNSRTGSLPVAEIYNFMCEHFPYFKTAPNGWKNSVRHNLSLNKCFEKIEKPASNGNQRKGCLWAMNPEKIAKMDEEVLKWSKKDPVGIKKAMVYPENLVLLERGDLKYESARGSHANYHSSASGTEESDSEDQASSASQSSVTNRLDDLDESSLNGIDIEVGDSIYEDFGLSDDTLNLGVTFASTDSRLISKLNMVNDNVRARKKSRLREGRIQGNYVCKSVAGSANQTVRRKMPYFFHTSVSPMVKLEDPISPILKLESPISPIIKLEDQ
ncbi:forkhead box protein A2-like isoform X2 [Bacillus rossius redtenbacheri]